MYKIQHGIVIIYKSCIVLINTIVQKLNIMLHSQQKHPTLLVLEAGNPEAESLYAALGYIAYDSIDKGYLVARIPGRAVAPLVKVHPLFFTRPTPCELRKFASGIISDTEKADETIVVMESQIFDEVIHSERLKNEFQKRLEHHFDVYFAPFVADDTAFYGLVVAFNITKAKKLHLTKVGQNYHVA